MDRINQQPAASSSSTALPAAIYTHRASSAPTLPTPEVDSTSFLDSVLRTSFGDDPDTTADRSNAQKLEAEKAALDKQIQELQELQKRLDAAEARRVALEKRKSTSLLSGSGVERAVSAGGSR